MALENHHGNVRCQFFGSESEAMLSFHCFVDTFFPFRFNNLTANYVEQQINLLFLKIIVLSVWICSIENISSRWRY
jgi:hypothetical protein